VKRIFERLNEKYPIYNIKIRDMNLRELDKLSKDLGLSLNREEMIRIRSYFRHLNRDPTDVELQAIAQAWSEHCCYKSSKYVLKRYIIGIEAPQVYLTGEDAGVVELDNDHVYVFKMESHNHPSAVEPYGGAATGVGGIIRDVLCMGAKPIALVDSLFFGDFDYPEKKIPKGIKNPRFIFNGVIAGIRDYGNRVGIPTVAGLTYFDKAYSTNVLVNVGCVGVCKKENVIRSMVNKPGINLVLVGGKTGRDGIHGVNFASRSFKRNEKLEKTAVQLGNPIIKEPLIHAVLESVDKKLIHGMKDLGGGGLSSVVGEMVLAGGVGAEVYLEKIPLKEKDMAPWEIWISESQERMMLAVEDDKLDELLEIFSLWDVDATVVGRTIEEEKLILYYHGIKVMDLDTHFITSGPVYCRPYTIEYPGMKRFQTTPPEPDYEKVVKDILSNPNVSNKSYVIRQYDHEVKGGTVLKPLLGTLGSETHSDAPVIKPFDYLDIGLAITSTSNPRSTAIDPYKGAKGVVDEAIRNLVSSNAIPHSFADNLNMGNPENPVVMGQLYEIARGLGEIAREFKIPYVSGNVSLYNETNGISIPPTPTLMGIGIVKDINKIVTVDIKKENSIIYQINPTTAEMGGSLYYHIYGYESSLVPDVNKDMLRMAMNSILKAMENDIILSCHDISDGGLFVTLSEMSIGSGIGMEINLENISDIRTDFKLFSESNSRWVVEIDQSKEKDFLKIMEGVYLIKLGYTGGNEIVINDGERKIIKMHIDDIRDIWNTIPR